MDDSGLDFSADDPTTFIVPISWNGARFAANVMEVFNRSVDHLNYRRQMISVGETSPEYKNDDWPSGRADHLHQNGIGSIDSRAELAAQ